MSKFPQKYKYLLFKSLVGNLAKIILRFFPKLTKFLTMNSNIKMSVGLLIPLIAIIVFFISIYYGNNIGAIFVAIGGLLTWFLYGSIMKSEMPDVTGNIIILFGFLLSSAFFLNYGLTKNMFGGYELILEGAAVSSTLLFVIVLLGINYKQRLHNVASKNFSTNSEDSSQTTKTPEEETVADIGDDSDTLYGPGEVGYDDYEYDYDYEPYGDDYEYGLEED